MELKQFSIPPVTKEFYEYLSKILTAPEIEPETYRDKLMFQAGMNHALKIIGKSVQERTVTSDPNAVVKPSLWKRFTESKIGRIIW